MNIKEINIELKIKSLEILQTSNPNSNTTFFKASIFRIDNSLNVFSLKGSVHPLFIPRTVAEKARESVNAAKRLPIDAGDPFDKHTNENIIGVMSSAEIEGSDFVVKGQLFSRYLFPWNQKDKVGAIALNQNDLEMFLNMKASGDIVKMKDSKVFYLSSTEILGANILFKT